MGQEVKRSKIITAPIDKAEGDFYAYALYMVLMKLLNQRYRE